VDTMHTRAPSLMHPGSPMTTSSMSRMTGGGGVGGVVSVCTLPGVVALRLCPLMLESSLPRCGVTALGVAAATPSPAESEKSSGANSCSPRNE
jgi:hypothetical protein